MAPTAIKSHRAAPKSPTARLRGRPPLPERIVCAVSLSSGRKGVSLFFIRKAIGAEGYDVARNKKRLNAAVAGMIEEGLLQRVSGYGVPGSFRIGRGGRDGLEGAARSWGAAPKARQRPALRKKKQIRRRAVKSVAKKSNKAIKRRGKAAKRTMVGGVEETGEGETQTAAAEGVLGAREME